jgi:hypothetical protein
MPVTSGQEGSIRLMDKALKGTKTDIRGPTFLSDLAGKRRSKFQKERETEDIFLV